MKIIYCKSSILYLLLNGKIQDVLTPWHLHIDFSNEVIIIKKRNWYLIGNNEDINAFRFIRSINIHERVIGADIQIKSMGNYSRVFCIKKQDINNIKNELIKYNQTKKNGLIIS
jgi:hypothetical protein